MTSAELLDALNALQDPVYREMQVKLIPNIDPETIIGVRTPDLRRLAREIEDGEAFLQTVPHKYFEENQVHAFLLERGKCFKDTVARVEAFLPYVDNWATCDQLRPKVFAKCHKELLPYICRWISSDCPYTIRFAVGMLMCHFLDGDFNPAYLEMAAGVQHEDYYVRMMVAWYFATALAKQYDAVLPYITEYRLEKWVHNKTIQKAVESYRITPEQKSYLRQFRLK